MQSVQFNHHILLALVCKAKPAMKSENARLTPADVCNQAGNVALQLCWVDESELNFVFYFKVRRFELSKSDTKCSCASDLE